ncbi:MAG: ABC transporter permease [Bacteroidetes bacterium]|nr:ABC transporter permease [Bacteroidota bacterium]
MIRNLIKTAFRNLLKNKGFTIINILGLTLGLATFLLILFYVTDELSYDRYNANADRIYRINADVKYGGNTNSFAIAPAPLAATMLSSFPEVERSTKMIQASNIQFKKGTKNIPESKSIYAESSLFDVFTLPMIAGNPKNALNDPNSIVISERAALKYFNKTDVVGQYLTQTSGNVHYRITGVIKNIPQQSHFDFDFFLARTEKDRKDDKDWNSLDYNTYVMLKKGTNIPAFEAKLNLLYQQRLGMKNYKELLKSGNYIKLNITPLTDIHLKSNRQYELGTNNSITYVYIFSVIALFVLLIACINFMNLSTARSANRAREVGIRKVLGSSRASLIWQFLAESVIITLVAAILALLTAWALLPLFNQLSGKELSLSLNIAAGLVPVLLAIVLIVGVLAGSYPAFYLSAFQPISVLKGKVASGFKGSLFRNFLVVFQFSISIFLIIGTLVIYNQLHFIQHKDLGFNRNQVLIVKNVQVLTNPKTFKQEVTQLSGVESATLSGFLPTGIARQPDYIFKDKAASAKNALYTEKWPVDPDYIKTMGMKITAGRNFSDQFAGDSANVVINETAARMLGYFNNPTDKILYAPEEVNGKNVVKEYHIIGMVKDFNFSSLRNNITPVVMLLRDDNGNLSVRTNTTDMKSLVARVQNIWDKLSPDQQFEYSFMDQDFDATYKTENRTGGLFITFTALAIIIACLGLFSLAAYAAEQRTKEIGIRKVLGASVRAITAMLSKDFIKLVTISIVIAAPLAWFAMNKWLEGFAYRLAIQWWILVSAALAAIVIAFVTISFQSIKAALANPVESLRSE